MPYIFVANLFKLKSGNNKKEKRETPGKSHNTNSEGGGLTSNKSFPQKAWCKQQEICGYTHVCTHTTQSVLCLFLSEVGSKAYNKGACY